MHAPITSAGFTLFESITVVMMISILTVMSFSSIPALRAHQELVADTEKIRSLMLDAKQRTLNQVRPEACLEELGLDVNDPGSAKCSDVGVAVQYGEIVEFANTVTSGAGAFKYDRTTPGVTGDYVITKSKPVTSITGESGDVSMLFMGVPPSVDLYSRGNFLSGDDTETVTLTASNGSQRTLKIYSFGTVDIE